MTPHVVAKRYTLGPKIGSGGMGDVYRAVDQQTNTPVAVKVLKSEVATDEMVARFRREGEALRKLNHPNIVVRLDAVQENGEDFLIMELVEGGTLDEILQQSPRLPLQRMLNIALDLTDALTRAHRLNIIHRDIKPANVLMGNDGMPRLTDFGIAHVVGSDITEAGKLLGTAAYISPEVLRGEPADVRSDIWSLGVMLYEMLVGVHPFRADNPATVVYAILSQPLPDLEAACPDAPAALLDLISRMTMKNPAERVPRMRLVGAELEALLSGDFVNPALELHETVVLAEGQAATRFATSSPSPVSAVKNNLPLQTTPFVGREHELVELEKLLHDPVVRLLTILAPGGMGKTRLAQELGGKHVRPLHGDTLFESGVYFVDLTPLTSPDNMVQTVAEAVSYAFQQDGRDAEQQLLDYLHEKNALLIMDNFEHVIAGHTLVQTILHAAPLVKILATSREKLNLSAETVFVLSGMEFPAWETPEDALEYAAVKLFMQSARRARSDFQIEAQDLAHVARICRLVQGTPLGILLAAAWLETLSPREIAQEISASLDFLESELRDLPERQRSLRAVFEYTWNLLTEQERDLFAQFSVFRGGFTREAAQLVTGTNLRTLTAMINKSLLRRDNTSGRYDIHELLRQYAEEKLQESSSRDSVHDAHSRYYAGLLHSLEPRLQGAGQLEALTLIETDFENIRAAWSWAVERANADVVEPAVQGMYLFLTFRNRFMDGDKVFQAARNGWSPDGETPSLLAGRVLVRFPQQPPLAHFQRGLEIAQMHKDAFEMAFCQRLIGHWLSHTEFKHPEGVAFMEASLKGFQTLDHKFCAAQVMDDMGWTYNLMLDQKSQLPRVKQSLELRREIGDKIGMANSLRNLGGSSGGFLGPTDAAFKCWQEAKEICYEMNDHLGIAWNANLQAADLIFKGEFDRAMALVEEAYPHAADINDPVVKGLTMALKGIILALRDEDYATAAYLFAEAYPPGSSPDFRLTIVPFGLSLVACGTSNYKVFGPYVSMFSDAGPFRRAEYYVPMLMPCLIGAVIESGNLAHATELLRTFLEGVQSYIGLPFPTQWAQRWGAFQRTRASLEAEMGADGFQKTWQQSTILPMSELEEEMRSFVEQKQ